MSAQLRATYRLQLTPDFGFAAAAELIPYLRDLGVSHLYLSPSLQARAGSTHGYDVVDPTRISDALGGEDGLRALADAVHGDGMGIVLDVVPNHMATDPANRFWRDPQLRERFFDVDPVSGRHRRFFDIDDLAGVRVELEDVFDTTHGLALRLLREGVIDGLRIDHPDGLADPAGYLRRLRDGGARHVWVEKILASSERLPADWPVSGTVGYEFLNDACGLFVDPAGEAVLTELWNELSGDTRPFGAYALEAKLEQARGVFTPEVERLGREATTRPSEDICTYPHMSEAPSVEALAWAVSSLPVYRTYDPLSAGPFITRFQQTTPAIMAKGVEDTAFYRYSRLLALNDVGGDPGRFGIAVDDFHEGNAARAQRHPEALLSVMTHDAKRSLDTRARMAVLSQIPERWESVARGWLDLSERHCSEVDGRTAPDRSERYFILQTLVGVWPIEPERLDGYLEKALREAKRNSNWVDQNAPYEQAVKRYARELAADAAFRASLEGFLDEIASRTLRTTLGQLVLKLTVPGVPDTYQGDEYELRALVDPDNRRPVDWQLRRERLAHLLGGGAPGDALGDRKLWVTARLLGLRARRPAIFSGAYTPLEAGPAACVFLRGDELLVAAALPRAGEHADPVVSSGLPSGDWRELLTAEQLAIDGGLPLSRLIDAETGVGVFERLSRD
ncbi:MAG TPA: malto-oligosyltrehalose synthase [Solirubrobacteraceae bacterium]|nr:malto-oligosyltrehalose synthase [Solirubrobacteraceae bacterium]